MVVFGEEEGGGGASPGDGGNGGVLVTGPTTVSEGGFTTDSTMMTTGTQMGGPNLIEVASYDDVTDPDVPLEAEVIANTLGITAVANTPTDFSEIDLARLTSPSGSVVIDDILPSNQADFLWYGSVAAATPQVSHPETFPLALGKWTFNFRSTTPANVQMWRRDTVDGAFHGGVLDVNLFLPENLIADVDLFDALAEAYTDWGGIELGQVTIYPLSDDFLIVDDQNVFDLVSQTSVVTNRPALNIMGTASIEGQFSGAAGFALGLPGISILHGTTSSAVVWMVLNDSFFDPIILRHEAGHFGGLFHTSEFQPPLVDPLTDTPECEDANLFDACPDYDYIMFPSGGSGVAKFSDLEARVLQGSTIYRGIYAPGEQPMPPYGAPVESDDSGFDQNGVWHVPSEIIEAAKQRVRARRAAGARHNNLQDDWAGHTSNAAAAHLAGIGCSARDYYGQLSRLAVEDLDAFVDILEDDSAPSYVRARAARAIASATRTSERAMRALETAARDTSAPGLVRRASLQTLSALGDERAIGAAMDLELDADPLVRRAAVAIQ